MDENGLFSTEKEVGGFDFVGEVWPTPDPARCGFNPNGSPRACLVPDPDPIDCGPAAIGAPCGGGHGSHVADIIGGENGGSPKGGAPGAGPFAPKSFRAASSPCTGLPLRQGLA